MPQSRAVVSATRYPLFSLALIVLASACTDTKTPTPTGVVAKDTKPVLQVLACSASTVAATVSCEPTAPSPSSGLRLDQKVFGGQGLYVRLTSSGVSYNSGTQIFSFNVTAQNLTQSPLSTANGTTRDDAGVRVFFAGAPAALPSGVISVANADGIGAFTAPNQSYFQYGGKLASTDQPELGADGILATAEVSGAKGWQLNVPVAVTSFTFQLYVASEVQTGTLVSAAPQIDSIRPLTLVPGSVMSVYGSNFNSTAANNVVNVGGVNVNGAAIFGTTQVSLVTPCVLSGSVPVKVTANGMTGVAVNGTLQVPVRTLGVGQTFVANSTAETRCNELAATGVASKYLISVFSDNTSPAASDPYQISADPTDAAEQVASQGSDEIQTPLVARGSYDFGYQAAVDKRHFDLLETNRKEYASLKAHFAADKRMKYSRSMSMVPVPIDTPVVDRVIRLSNISPPAGKSICNSYYSVNAHRVYYNGKIAIYEDADSTPVTFKAASNPAMAAYYQKIGDQFNNDMEPILKNNFGDVLRRDPVTDHNGVLIALFTPMINKKFSGVAGFVVSCDQFPNDSTGGPGSYANSTSNLGEFFYAYQPVTAGTGYGGNTADQWYRTIRSTFIHESKHVVAFAARVENNAPTYELSAFEEGMARTSEEMWAREAVYAPLAFKGNTGYGSAANPVNVYCDVRPSGFAACDANPRGPASVMQRHFTSLYTNLLGDQGRLLSPFGPTASDNASYFYATAWSLLRYSADHYGASDAAFLTAMTQATTSGTASLTAITGASLDNILGGWALAQSADDYPGLTFANSPVSQNPTWNWRNIYAGLNSDFPTTYALPYPSVPTAFAFGSFGPSAPLSSTMRGGGVVQYSISGTQTAPQLVRLENNGGGPVSSNIRVAIVRVQ